MAEMTVERYPRGEISPWRDIPWECVGGFQAKKCGWGIISKENTMNKVICAEFQAVSRTNFKAGKVRDGIEEVEMGNSGYCRT